jgi:hypothetical protein
MAVYTIGRLLPCGLTTLVLAGLAVQVSAQPRSRFYAGASAGGFSVHADEVSGSSGAGGLFGGIALSRYADAEFEVVWPSSPFTRSYTGISVSFAAPGSSPEEIVRLGVTTFYDKRRDVESNLSGVVILHPQLKSTLTPGVIAGVTNQRVRERTAYTPLTIPPGIDPGHPAVAAREEAITRNIGALTVGANLAIAITPRFFIVPDVRYDFGSIGDEINNALRGSIRAQWRF